MVTIQWPIEPSAPKTKAKQPHDPWPTIYLRCVDPGTDCECWVVCAKGDPGAKPFRRLPA